MESNSFSRRDFLTLVAGTTVAAATFNAKDAFANTGQVNKTKVDTNTFKYETQEADVLVVGGGIAGLFAAVKAHDAGAKVRIVSKGGVGSSGLTPFGKGVFSYDKKNPSMSMNDFLAKVAESSLETNNPVFTKQLLEHSYDRVQELKEWGFFDSVLCVESFLKPLNARSIPYDERIMITHLLKENGKIIGASGFSIDENKIIHYYAKTTILCTGAGGFKPNGFPMCDLTHDGTIMAYKAGAKVTGKEWNDGHPASAVNSGSCYHNWNGQIEEKPKIDGPRINHHLGVNLNYEAYMNGAPVSRNTSSPDISGRPPSPFVPASFRMPARPQNRPSQPPRAGGNSEGLKILGVAGATSQNSTPHHGGPDARGEQVGGSTAGMAIHKAEGLVPINEKGLSTLPGLYAAGDALGSYLSGGIYTQIGSSMSGSAVQGAISGEAAALDAKKITKMTYPSNTQIAKINEEILAPLKRERGFSPAWVTQVLQGVMVPNFALYIQKESIMQASLIYVNELFEHHVPMLIAKDLHELRLAHETENMIISAQMKLKASLMRTESRCSHYRLDYPRVDYENWQAWINIYKDDKGHMQLEKQAFSAWPEFV